MKNLFIILFSFLLLAPPMQAHTDVLVYNNVAENHIELENNHEKEHHKNDSEDEKKSDHHHHCNSVNLIDIFIPIENKVCFSNFSSVKKTIIYYNNPDYQSYLDTVFQPPKNV